MDRGSARAEAGGGLYKGRAGPDRGLTGCGLFLVGEQAGLDDDLYDSGLGRLDYRLDILFHKGHILILDGADIDDHVHLVRAGSHCRLGLKGLGFGDHGPEREAYHAAGVDAGALELRRHQRRVTAVHADRGEAVLLCLRTVALDCLPGGIRLQHCMIDYFCKIH